MQMNRRKLVQIVLMLGFILVGKSAFATTYYIDYSSGNDSNGGTSKSSPWQHAPGMNGCTANCAATNPQPGDSIILKGGVAWPMNTIGCWELRFAGSATNQLYVGVDKTWYAGGSWARPILNGNGTNTGACTVNSGYTTLHNVFVVLEVSHITLDNIEFTGARWGYGESYYVDGSFGPDYYVIENCYFHGWSTDPAYLAADNGHVFYRSPGYPVTSGILDHNVFDGSDTPEVQADPNCTGACSATTEAFYGFATIARYNVVRYMSNGFVGDVTVAHDNLFEYIRQSTSASNHMNDFENNSDCNARFYNNVIRHDVTTSVVNLWIATSPGCADYVFNNVIYDTAQANIVDIAPVEGCATSNCGPSGTIYVLNNTVEAGPDSGPAGYIVGCASSYGSCVVANNYQISSIQSIAGCPASNCSVQDNKFQPQAAASLLGYTLSEPYAFLPTAAGGPLSGAGNNYSALCSVDSDLANLCQDTTFGVSYNSSAHTAGAAARSTSGRPASGAWDVGAYEFSGIPGAPTGLTAAVN
jgi:hypothetical protein